MLSNDHLQQLKAHILAFVKTRMPTYLDRILPGLGIFFELGIEYSNERAAQNLEKLVKLLQVRVQNLEDKLKTIPDGLTAKKNKRTLTANAQ